MNSWVAGLCAITANVLSGSGSGYLVSAFGWPWAFFVNVPLGIIAIVIAQRVLQPTAPDLETRFDGVGFATAALGIALLLYGVTIVMEAQAALWASAFLGGGLALLGAFVISQYRIRRRGGQPLLDLRRFGDHTFTLSTIAMVLQTLASFGILFLMPSYLQTVRHVSITESGASQGVQALATLLALPIAGRLSDRFGPRPIALAGLSILAAANGLLMTISISTSLELVMGVLALLGCAGALTGQIQVAAMSGIGKEAHHDVAHGSTLISVLRAAAAPLGVALLSSIAQTQSQRYEHALASQGLANTLIQQQSAALAMRDCAGVAMIIAALAVLAMFFVPRRAGRQSAVLELPAANEGLIVKGGQ